MQVKQVLNEAASLLRREPSRDRPEQVGNPNRIVRRGGRRPIVILTCPSPPPRRF